jgi:serine O-acetyltransferase
MGFHKRKGDVMLNQTWPKNPHIKNTKFSNLYIFFLRKKWRIPKKVLGLLAGCDILCPIPERLYMPHPFGIVADTRCKIGNDVVLLQHVTLGGRYPYQSSERTDPEKVDPILNDGVYVGPGAKILGNVTIGEWSIIGANAVITIDLPPYSIAVGHNIILKKKTTDL